MPILDEIKMINVCRTELICDDNNVVSYFEVGESFSIGHHSVGQLTVF